MSQFFNGEGRGLYAPPACVTVPRNLLGVVWTWRLARIRVSFSAPRPSEADLPVHPHLSPDQAHGPEAPSATAAGTSRHPSRARAAQAPATP
jgi:hypothetical protein